MAIFFITFFLSRSRRTCTLFFVLKKYEKNKKNRDKFFYKFFFYTEADIYIIDWSIEIPFQKTSVL